ncbi:MAG: chemotaxis-specific protein-glutamate methyltransferase CheB [Selenomonadaceae bacterium]|nr:chemotaxis-specific protein-glutamate methyltransferase CheB [Selenomonadaceae bacterium]
MNKGLRVLIVDDSMVFRETLFNELERFLPAGSILDKADDPFSARDKILEFKPDVMLLDVEMPKMDGIEFLRRLLAQYPLPTVVMSADSDYCTEALMAGACDFVTKPGSCRTLDDAFLSDVALRLKIASLRKVSLRPYDWHSGKERQSEDVPSQGLASIRRQFVNPKTAADVTAMYLSKIAATAETTHVITSGIKVSPGSVFTATNRLTDMLQKKEESSEKKNSGVNVFDRQAEEIQAALSKVETMAQAAPVAPLAKGNKKISVIAIGASTGGTVALTKVITALRPPLPPIVVVQHIPANFSRLFAERLNEESALEVKEAKDGERIEKNHVYIAPGGLHMKLNSTITGMKLECAPGKPVNSVCPAVDVLFETVAEFVGDEALGVILTGMGRDGADGLLKMRKAGAVTIGQDERTCVVYGMPKAAWDAGAVQRQMPIDAIAGSIMAIASGDK